MINRIFFDFLKISLGAALMTVVFAANPVLAQLTGIGLDRLILNLIEALYAFKNMG